ncbi:MAG TPA: response regulator [Vicinamibacterales bacterium]|nr:response regulator [Vicinamibacterales bacterium]
MTDTKRRGRGRPPAGADGDRVVDYPQLALRIPPATFQKLQAIAMIEHQPQWRTLSHVLDSYIAQLPEDQRQLIDGLVKRAGPLLSQSPRSRRRSAAPRAVTLLNVDDHEPMLFARSAIFRAEGYNVIEAQNGRTALDLARRHRPHVILLDVHLPDINGVEICRQIKADPQTSSIKVVQLSATTKSPRDQLYGLETGGADIFLTEPLTRGTLLSVVKRLVNGTAA